MINDQYAFIFKQDDIFVCLKTWLRIKREVIRQGTPDPSNMPNIYHCLQRIQDAVDDVQHDRILEEEDVMSSEAGEFLNDGDLAENENVDDEIEMPSRYS